MKDPFDGGRKKLHRHIHIQRHIYIYKHMEINRPNSYHNSVRLVELDGLHKEINCAATKHRGGG